MVRFNKQTIEEKVGDVDEVVVVPKAEYEELKERASYDPRTGLMNVYRFEEQLRHDLSVARRDIQKGGSPDNLVLAILDLNGMKYVNDKYGHNNGHNLLKGCAHVLNNVFRREEDTIARIGGDEFGVILPKTDIETAYLLKTKFQERAENLGILVAVGMASYKLSVNDPIKGGQYVRTFDEVVSELQEKADQDMYLDKQLLYQKIPIQKFYDARFGRTKVPILHKEAVPA